MRRRKALRDVTTRYRLLDIGRYPARLTTGPAGLTSSPGVSMSKPQPQIGFRVDEAYEVQLQQALAITGKDRATFAREAVRAAMLRAIDGPEASEPEAAPRLDIGDAAAVIRRLEGTLVEFRQVAGEHQRQAAELRKLARDDAGAMHRARAEFLEGYPERILKSTRPVHEKLAELSGKLDELPGVAGIHEALTRIEDAVGTALAAMVEAAKEDRTAAAAEARATRALIEKAMAEPRTINTIDLRSWTLGQLGVVAGIFWLVSVGVLYAIIMLLPADWVAVRTANHLLGGGEQAICQLVNYRQSTDTCRYQVGRKGSLVTVGATEGEAR